MSDQLPAAAILPRLCTVHVARTRCPEEIFSGNVRAVTCKSAYSAALACKSICAVLLRSASPVLFTSNIRLCPAALSSTDTDTIKSPVPSAPSGRVNANKRSRLSPAAKGRASSPANTTEVLTICRPKLPSGFLAYTCTRSWKLAGTATLP